MELAEIDFSADSFADIMAKDDRYNSRAYALLSEVIRFLGEGGKHMTGEDILAEFKELALDQYGPLTFSVLREWGVSRCEDIGEMMFNLVDSGRIRRDEDDNIESFAGGYDFKETFLGPYEI
jgi:uncharacterized repeat protein (TIGR04138 family)